MTKVFSCDKCGAEFERGDEDWDEQCPECGSDLTMLMDEY